MVAIPPESDKTNDQIGEDFEAILVDLRSLAEEAARRLTHNAEAKQNPRLQRAYRGSTRMLAALEEAKRPDGSL